MRSMIAFLLGLQVVMLPQFAANAQAVRLGIKGGVSVPNLTAGGSLNNPLNTGYSSILGADAAVFGEYSISDVFSLELAAEYSKQGGQKNGNQAIPVPSQIASQYPPGEAPPYLWATIDNKVSLDYLLIPLLAKCRFSLGDNSALKWYIDAGPFAGFLLSAKTITSGTSNVYEDQKNTQPLLPGPIPLDATTDIKSQLHAANFGVEANLGIEYAIKRYALLVEVGGNYGFLNIQKYAADGQNHTGAAVARIGLTYQLTN